jgi:hypothetical protein
VRLTAEAQRRKGICELRDDDGPSETAHANDKIIVKARDGFPEVAPPLFFVARLMRAIQFSFPLRNMDHPDQPGDDDL